MNFSGHKSIQSSVLHHENTICFEHSPLHSFLQD